MYIGLSWCGRGKRGEPERDGWRSGCCGGRQWRGRGRPATSAPSAAHQPAGRLRAGLGSGAAGVGALLPVLPELPAGPAHPGGARAQGLAAAATVEVHHVLGQRHGGPGSAQPALPQHPVILHPLQVPVPQTEAGSGPAHRRAPLAPGALPQPAAAPGPGYRRRRRRWTPEPGPQTLPGPRLRFDTDRQPRQLPGVPEEWASPAASGAGGGSAGGVQQGGGGGGPGRGVPVHEPRAALARLRRVPHLPAATGQHQEGQGGREVAAGRRRRGRRRGRAGRQGWPGSVEGVWAVWGVAHHATHGGLWPRVLLLLHQEPRPRRPRPHLPQVRRGGGATRASQAAGGDDGHGRRQVMMSGGWKTSLLVLS